MALLLTLPACGESRGEGSLDGGGSGQHVNENDGGPGDDSDDDSATDGDGYRVSLQAAATEVCAGECTTLSVQVESGLAPYHYAWQPAGAGESAATLEVCPSQTTGYQVTVTDSAGGSGEFGGDPHQATASVEVAVRTGCNPAATACSARIPFTHPNHLSGNSGLESQAEIATDSHGNLIMIGTFQGSIDFGGGLIKSTSYSDAFVLKLSSSCKFLWVKTLGNASALIGHSTVAVTSNDQMFVSGSFSGTLNFGDQSRSATKQAAYVLKLDEGGNVLWSRSYASGSYDNFATDLGVTDNGEVVFGGIAGPDTDFGGGAIGGDVYNMIGSAYVASLNADGAHRFSHPLRKTSPEAPIAVHGSGKVALSGMGMAPTVQVDSGSVSVFDPGGGRYVVMLDSAGDFSWGKPLSRTPPAGGRVTAQINGGASIVFAPDGSLVADQGHLAVEDTNGYIEDPQRLVKLDAQGKVLWDRTRALLGEGAVGYWTQLAVDGQGNILHGDLISPNASVDGHPLPVRGERDIYLEKLTPSGDLVWAKTLGGMYDDWPWGITTDASDSIWITTVEGASAADIPGGMNSGAVVITKLAP